MSKPVTEERVDVYDGKYTVILRSDGTSTALRHGEAWPAFAGQTQLDNLTTALARDLIEARDMVVKLTAMNADLRANWEPKKGHKV